MKTACSALGVPRRTFYNRRKAASRIQQPRPKPARSLKAQERKAVVDVLCTERFVDRSPAEVVATLLDEGTYLCSERTMYRVLAKDHAPARERRSHRTHPERSKPELLATGPNQVWSWDITQLKGPRTWEYFYLYVMLDIYSRYVVGYMVADRQNAALGGRLIQESCDKHQVRPDTLTIHNDRGSPMTARCTAELIADLGVFQSFSRPQVSDDNPFSEAAFKTVKYYPGFPKRFTDINHARQFCGSFFSWYNAEHRHSGIAMLTPEQVHYGRALKILKKRQGTLHQAWLKTPERFVKGPPCVRQLPQEVWINPPQPEPVVMTNAL